MTYEEEKEIISKINSETLHEGKKMEITIGAKETILVSATQDY